MKKKLGLIFVIEILIFAVYVGISVRNFQKNETTVEYDSEQLQVMLGATESGYYIDTGMDDFKDIRIGLRELTLPRGSYEVKVRYNSRGTTHMGVNYNHGRNDYAISGEITLEGIETERKFQISIDMDREPINMYFRLNSECVEGDYLLVSGVTFTSTFTWYKLHIFKLLLFMLLLDICIYVYLRKDKIQFSQERRKVLVSLGIITFIASIPLMTNYLLQEQDLAFHLTRIEGIVEGLLAGEFPVRIQPQWLNGHGYPTSVFYGDVLLYIPACLRLMGFDPQISYKIFVVLVNFATAGIAYLCFSKIGSNQKIGIVAAAVYSLNLYRFTNLYVRAAVGEYSATIFFPVILYGLWYIFTKELEVIKKSSIWIVLALGYLGVLYSHLISCEMVGIFTILVCLLQIRKVFQKERFLALLKAFIGMVVGGLWFAVPLLDYMQLNFLSGDMNRFVLYRQEERGLFLSQFFVNRYDVTSQSLQTSLGMAGEMPLTLGISCMVIMLAAVYISICWYKSITKKKEWFLCIFLMTIAMWFSTKYFPFAWFARKSEFLKMLVNSLQYPWRFLAIVSVLCTWLFVLILKEVKVGDREKRIFAVVVGTILLIDSVSMLSEVLNSQQMMLVKDGGNLSSFGVSGGEYLYTGYNLDDYVGEITEISEGVAVESYQRGRNQILIQVTNTSSEEKTVELPLIRYKGYRAKDTGTGDELYLSDGNSHRAVLHLPAGYSGNVIVKFMEPWYWRMAEIVSLAGYIAVIFWELWKKRKKKINKQEAVLLQDRKVEII